MDFSTFLRKIEMPKEFGNVLCEIAEELDSEQYVVYMEGLTHREQSLQSYIALRSQFSGDDTDPKLFVCMLECARNQYSAYQALGISEKVYFDTMKCFSRFVNESKENYGTYFFDRGGWAFRQLSLKVFRIGELEYELCADIDETFQKRPVHIHIPSDAKLNSASIDLSFAEAKKFLTCFFPEYADSPMLCETWMLSPVIGTMLPESSNIRAFQKHFEICHVVDEEIGCLLWLFQASADTPYETLKENTSLQRKAKAHLLAGGKIGSGCGIVKGM